MAAGDPYIECGKQIPTELILRDMIVQDENGKPAWRTYGSGGGSGGFYNLVSPTTEEMFGMPVDSDITGLTWQQIIQWMATGIAPPNIIVDTTAIDFGDVGIGSYSSESKSVQKLNLTAPCIIQSNSSRFIVNNDNSNTNMSPLNIGQTDGTVTIYIKYNPIAEQSNSGVISISSIGVTTKTISVTGTGVEASPFITFGTDGTVTQEGDYKIVEFTDTENPGQIDFTFVPEGQTIEVEVIAGGGGGAGGKGNGNGAASGGGGAGQYIYIPPFSPLATIYAAFVGKGGLGSAGTAADATLVGEKGGNSYFGGYTAEGGGYGGVSSVDSGVAGSGGNGGGGGGIAGAPSPGGIGIDNNGGASINAVAPYRGGGGGSTLEPGFDGSVSGNGGGGTVSPITGLKVAAGGGGGCYQGNIPGNGGDGGGGNGATEANNGGNGTTDGSGGGGGGAPGSGTGGNGGNGFRGIVRIKIYSPA